MSHDLVATTIDQTNAAMSIQNPYRRTNKYGFPLSYSGGTTRYFLTNRTDQYGSSVTYTYERHTNDDSSIVVRLIQMTDLDGKQCTLDYTNALHPNLITRVTDPYNRIARFFYNTNGILTSITDMAGLSSLFQYDTTGAITNLHTDYGDTRFRYYWGATSSSTLNRAIEITEATGQKQLYVYRDHSDFDVGYYDTPDSTLRDRRNSFHFNRQQYAALSANAKTNVLDMAQADIFRGSIKHWYHGETIGTQLTVSSTLAASAGPVAPFYGEEYSGSARVSPVSFVYVGQTSGDPFIGDLRVLTQIRWSFGVNQIDFVRNAWGRPAQFIYHRNGSPVAYTNEFNADGRRLERVWGPHGEQLRAYGYDATLTNLLTSVTNAAGEEIRYTHDAALKVVQTIMPGGLVGSNVYYSSGPFQGFLQSSQLRGFRTNYFGYENGNVSGQTNELGLITSYAYDDLNRLKMTVFPDNTTISNLYDKLDLVGVKDRLDHWTHYGFNSVRQLLAATNVNGQITQYGYCDCGALTSITNWLGATPIVASFLYDIAGRRTNALFADGYSISYFYPHPATDGGGPIWVEDSSGVAAHYEFADYWKLAKIGLSPAGHFSPDGDLITRSYDDYGRLRSSTDRNGVTTTNAYDVLDRLTVQAVLDSIGALRSTNAFTYTPCGLTNSVDALGFKTWFNRDSLGRLLSRTNANNEILQFTYNAADEMLTLTDGRTNTTTWNYDEYGRATNKVDAATNVIFRYNYDANNRLTNRWTPAKGDTFYSYDALGNVTAVDYPGTIMDITMQYDALNRLTNVTDAIGTTKFNYDNAGLLLSEDGPWADDTITYTYNARRRVGLSLQQPNATPRVQTYAYDQYNRLTNTTSLAGTFGYTYWYGSTLSDRILNLGLPGNFDENNYVRNDFDQLARLTSTILYKHDGTVLNSHSYQMNDANQRTRQTFTAGNYIDYTYDKIGQLLTAKGKESATAGGATRLHEQFSYGYDEAWNLSHRTNNALVEDFSVNNLNELTTSGRNGTFTAAGAVSTTPTSATLKDNANAAASATVYSDNTFVRSGLSLLNGTNTFVAVAQDGAGSGRADTNTSVAYLPGTNAFVYDANGNLVTNGVQVLEYDFENQLTNIFVPGAWRSEFHYDQYGRCRIQKDFGWQGGTWVQTNELHRIYTGLLVLQERNANNLASVTYTRGLDIGDGLASAGGIGGLLARTDMAKVNTFPAAPSAFFHADGNGNITMLVAANGGVLAQYGYDASGNTVAATGPLCEINRYRFSTREIHALSGLLFYPFRLYSPNLQRWLNRDPLGEYADINLLYAANNDFVNWVDPDGLSGTLTINTQNAECSGCSACMSDFGHAWVVFKPDDPSQQTHSYGTFGLKPYGLRVDTELNDPQKYDVTGASRSVHISDEGESLLYQVIDRYRGLGSDAWTYVQPCSSFAVDAWNTATGQHLSAGFPSLPMNLSCSINTANHADNPVPRQHPILRSPKDAAN